MKTMWLCTLVCLTACTSPFSNQKSALFDIVAYAGTGDSAYAGDKGPAFKAQLNNPVYTALDTSGNLYVADWGNNVVRRIDPAGTITTVIGTGTAGYTGDGGPAAAAELWNPNALAVDDSGNLYISDWGNNVVRKVGVNGKISTFAGTGIYGYAGDGGPATQASFRWPTGVAVDKTGAVYISDSNNNVIRRVDASGTISTFAGTGGNTYAGDGGTALSAQFDNPTGLAIEDGNLFITDYNHHAIRKIDSLGVITTIAGNGLGGFSGDSGHAVDAELKYPGEISLDSLGNLFIADTGNNRIRRVDSLGRISTIAGNGTAAFSGDNGQAVSASLSAPNGVVADAAGNLLIADSDNNRVRKVILNSVNQQNAHSSPTAQGENTNANGNTQSASQ